MTIRATTSNKTLREFPLEYMDNLKKLLDRYNRSSSRNFRLDANKIVIDDDVNVGKFPIIGLEFDSHREEPLTLGSISRKYKVFMRVNIWFYEEKIGTNFKKRKILTALGAISSIIRENPNINGFCHDSAVLGSFVYPRIKDDSLIAAGVVLVESQKVMRQNVLNTS